MGLMYYETLYLKRLLIHLNDLSYDRNHELINLVNRRLKALEYLGSPVFFNKEEVLCFQLNTDLQNYLMTKHKISIISIIKDEEAVITNFLNNALMYCDEIVIVDTGSTDSTVEIINQFKDARIKLYFEKWADDFSFHRNHSVDLASFDLVFVLDADERILTPIYEWEDIISTFNDINTTRKVYATPIFNLSNNLVSTGMVRFFDRKWGFRYEGKMHEDIRTKDSLILLTKIRIDHLGYSSRIMKDKDKRNRNLRLTELDYEHSPNSIRSVYYYTRDRADLLSCNELFQIVKSSLKIESIEDLVELGDTSFAIDILVTMIMQAATYGEFERCYEYSKVAAKYSRFNSDIFYYMEISKCALGIGDDKESVRRIIEFIENNCRDELTSIYSSIGLHIYFVLALRLINLKKYKGAYDILDLYKKHDYLGNHYDTLVKILDWVEGF